MFFRPRKYCELFISNLFPSFFSVLCVWKSCFSDVRQSGLVLQFINLFSNHLSLCVFICSAFLGISSFCLLALQLSFSNVNMFLISKSSFMLAICFYFIASYFLFSRCNLLSFLEPLNVLNILSLFYIAFADYTLYLLIF